jgi:hypothetical protein
MCGNYDYFNSLYQRFTTDEFKNNLGTFFLTNDISKFNQRVFPDSEIRHEIIQSNKESWKLFMEHNYEKFIKGYHPDSIHPDYISDCERRKCQPLGEERFKQSIKSYTYKKQKRYAGSRPYFYFLNQDYLKTIQDAVKKEEEKLKQESLDRGDNQSDNET